jgi:hypothetical protein
VRPKPTVLEAPDTAGIVKASLVRTKPLALDLDDLAPSPAKPVVKKADAAPKKVAAIDAKPKPKPALTTASLLPSDLGKLIAAEKKTTKPARNSADR